MSRAIVFEYRPRMTLASLLSVFDIRVKLNPFLRKSDLAKLAQTSQYMEEQVELMMQLHWYECPRITDSTDGSWEHEFVLDCWDRLTFHGALLPLSDGLHSKVLRTKHLRTKLALVTLHSKIWINNEAFGHIIRWFGLICLGKARRDGDLVHDVQSEMEKYFDTRRAAFRSTFRGARDTVSELRCIDTLHTPADMADLRADNVAWWYNVVIRYIVACFKELRNPYEIQDALTVGSVMCIKINDRRLARVECYHDFVQAKGLFEIAEPIALKAVKKFFL